MHEITIMSQYFSPEGLEKLKKELEDREQTVRADIAHRISGAKELGDLSENAEYTEAREAQALNEGRVEEIKRILRDAIVVNKKASSEVTIGSTVSVEYNGSKKDFVVVGANEAEPAKGFISNESPLGLAFMGKKKGDEVKVDIPSGKAKYKILKVT